MWHLENSQGKQTFERTNESKQQARSSLAKILQRLDNWQDSISLKRRSRLHRHLGGEKGPWGLANWGFAASELSHSSWAWIKPKFRLGGTW